MKLFARFALAALIPGTLAIAQTDDASVIRRLPVEGFAQFPVISPDGARVAFSREGYSPVEVLDLTTATSRVLCTHAGAGWGLVWLDNTHIVVRSLREDPISHSRSMGIEILNVAAGTEAEGVAFAPRNRLDIPVKVEEGIVAVRNGGQLMVVDARGQTPVTRAAKNAEVIWTFEGSSVLAGNTRISAPGSRDVLSFTWSPDGTVALVELLGRPSLYLFRPASGEFSLIADGGERPCWVDAEQFVYMRVSDDGHDVVGADIYLGTVRGGEMRNLTAFFDAPALNPSASRDGKVVFNSKNGELYILHLLAER